MDEPYSIVRPKFPRQIRNVRDLHAGEYVFTIHRVGDVWVRLYKILTPPHGEWVNCSLILDGGRNLEEKKRLQDHSVLPYANGVWNCSNFLIPAGKQRNPLTKEEELNLIRELGIKPLPSIKRRSLIKRGHQLTESEPLVVNPLREANRQAKQALALLIKKKTSMKN